MKLRISATVVLCLALFSLQSTYAQGSKSGKVISNLRLTGTTSLSTTGSGTSTAVGMEIRNGPEPDEGFEKQIKGTIAPARVRAAQVPRPVGSTVQAPGPEFSGFNGLTHLDQRLAGTGIYTNTQFTSEPPDNTMAVSDSHIVEAVNTAIVVRDKTGAVVAGPIPANQFYNLTPAFDRVTGLSGDFMTDPKVYFDVDTQRWFITYLQIDVDPVTGGLLSGSHVEIAVSKSSDPTGAWYLYALDVTDDGTDGTPSHPDCPCFGD